jgi:hypothetical protein
MISFSVCCPIGRSRQRDKRSRSRDAADLFIFLFSFNAKAQGERRQTRSPGARCYANCYFSSTMISVTSVPES